MKRVEELIYQTGIIPVISIERKDLAVPLARALFKGGIPAAEITFRTEAAAGAILRISDALPEMFVCAGTVLSVEQAELAVKNGAKAVISPGLNPQVVEWCLDREIPVFPGCATPTEIETAMRMGLRTVKLFPAQVVGGTAMLKALYGPYREMKFMPTGGINPDNVTDYLRLPNVTACGGSWLCPAEAVRNENWEKIEALASQAKAVVERVRCS